MGEAYSVKQLGYGPNGRGLDLRQRHWSIFSLTFSECRGIFPQGQSVLGAKLSTLFYLMLRLGMNGTAPLLAPTPLRALTPTTVPLPIYLIYINKHS